uniref:UBIQUITIN_CONJUGAT_2 domain-containing protein n=1 Tax=Heterorhabditis bacteriophora TaxID=37862 RepID=A0A1I7X9A1_HETBA
MFMLFGSIIAALLMEEEYESVALVKPEVFVYRIPPLTNNRGHKIFVINKIDHFKYIEKSAELAQQETTSQPSLDLAFKEGQTISINIGKKHLDSQSTSNRTRPTPSTGGAVPPLPPPPGATSVRSRTIIPSTSTAPTGTTDLFMDFPVPSCNPSPTAIRRLRKDLERILQEPIDEWHYCLKGSPGTHYEGGYYYGKLIFQPDFPWKPPAICMITPNGRLWLIKVGLHSFMNEDTFAAGTCNESPEFRRHLAANSKNWNLKNPNFVHMFPDLVDEFEGRTPLVPFIDFVALLLCCDGFIRIQPVVMDDSTCRLSPCDASSLRASVLGLRFGPASAPNAVDLDMVGASVTATARLKKDYHKLLREPVPFMKAAPLHENILEWHYIIFGAPNTPYEDFHPDTWNPAWTVSTIITGLLSFMNDTSPTLGSITSSDAEKKILARRSKAFNLRVYIDIFDMNMYYAAGTLISTAEDAHLREEEERVKRMNFLRTYLLAAIVVYVLCTLIILHNCTCSIANDSKEMLKLGIHKRSTDFPNVVSKLPETFLLVVIMSSPNSSVTRAVIRDTWLKLSTKGPDVVRHLFPIGMKGISASLRSHIDEEEQIHRDLAILDSLEENYANLAKKTLNTMEYAYQNYKFQYLLKLLYSNLVSNNNNFLNIIALCMNNVLRSVFQRQLICQFHTAITVLSQSLSLVSVILSACLVTLLIFVVCEYHMSPERPTARIVLNKIIDEHHHPTTFLTYYRSTMLLLVGAAILAVDFPVFPRRFAKTGYYICAKVLPRRFPILLGVLFCIMQQALLMNGYEWILSGKNTRETLFSANAEGICSMMGYLALYYISDSVAEFISKTGIRIKSWLECCVRLFCLAVIFFVFQLIAERTVGPPCRRVVNVTYIFAQMSLLVFSLACFLCVQLFSIVAWAANVPHFSADMLVASPLVFLNDLM